MKYFAILGLFAVMLMPGCQKAFDANAEIKSKRVVTDDKFNAGGIVVEIIDAKDEQIVFESSSKYPRRFIITSGEKEIMLSKGQLTVDDVGYGIVNSTLTIDKDKDIVLIDGVEAKPGL